MMLAPDALSPAERAANAAPLIKAAADEIEREQIFPASVMAAIHDARLFHLLLPHSLGGEEAHPADFLDALREIAKADASVAWNMFVANSACLIAPHIPFESAQAIYSDAKASVAWGPPDAQTFQAVEGGYRVSGTWRFASGCRQATWMGAHGQVREADGSLRLGASGKPTTRSVLFPIAQAERLGDWNPIGLKGTASESYRVEDIFVPEAFSGTRETPEARRDPGPLYAYPMQGLYGIGVAGVALGLAEAMLDDYAALAAEKTPRGRPKLGQDPLVQFAYAKTKARLEAAHAYALSTLNDIHSTAPETGALDIPERARVRLISIHAITESIEVADWVYKQAGVDAIFAGSAFQRRFRDIHTLSQQIQSRDAHFEAVGQVLLGQSPEVFF